MDIRQVVITRAGAPERLRLQTSRLDPPAPGEAQVEVVAAGINFADILARQGLYPDAPPLPLVVGYEVSGTVRAVGTGSRSHWSGRTSWRSPVSAATAAR